MNNSWLNKNTFHYADFRDLERLVAQKEKKKISISLCLPTLNEEKTIAKEIVIMKSELMTRYPLLDEIVVVDSGSTDRTRKIAREYGADVYEAADILPQLGHFRGKGENLWKALYITRGDIIVYLDADIKNIHHRFVYALVAPLLLYDGIKYCKAFYDRPIATSKNIMRSTGGGRVTELVIRPLFSLFFPELTQIIQPLSGEYAGFRDVLEKIPFPIGYGIETSLILDIYERWKNQILYQDEKKEGWIITNTRCSSRAISYSKCVGLKIAAWNYPKSGNLRELIENVGLHPITALVSLSSNQKAQLLNENIVLLRQLIKQGYHLKKMGINKLKIDSILEEAKNIIKT